jgi:DNA modification methylase
LLAKWNVEPGQLWIIEGRRGTTHRVLCGDCRRSEDVSRLLGGAEVTVGFTSPPYAAQRKYDAESGFLPIAPDEYTPWFEAVQANVRDHLAPDGSWFVNIKAHSEDGQRHLYVMDLVQAHVRRWGWRFIDDLCWARAGVPGSWPNRFKNGWEPIYHFCREPQIRFRPEAVGLPTEHAFLYAPGQQIGGRSKSNTLRSARGNGKSPSGSGLLGKEHAAGFHAGLALPSNVVEVGSGGGQVSGQHPAEFPVGLPRWFLLAYSDVGDAVFDPFAGSGATLLAAEQTRRAGFGMEISPKYTAVILERFSTMGLVPGREENGR